jgi:hypothetical protein
MHAMFAGELLSEAITKKVIVLVLVLLIILPVIQFTPNDGGPEFMVNLLQEAYMSSSIT